MSEIKVITSVQRRRQWSAEEKREIVEKSKLPGMSISHVARKYDVHPSQLFRWRRLAKQEGQNPRVYRLNRIKAPVAMAKIAIIMGRP